MSIIKKTIYIIFFLVIFSFSTAQSEELQKLGKFKDWEAVLVDNKDNKVCFAQSKPVLQSPKKGDREARLFVTFRPSDNCLLYTSPSPRDS